MAACRKSRTRFTLFALIDHVKLLIFIVVRWAKNAPYPNSRDRPMHMNLHDARREFQRSPELQAEFGDEAVYLAYSRGVASGAIAPPREPVVVTAPPRKPAVVTEPNPVASRSLNSGLREIWDLHGPQSGRVYCSGAMSRFESFDEFAAHVARHNPTQVRR
jgi:hypothetical protein